MGARPYRVRSIVLGIMTELWSALGIAIAQLAASADVSVF